MPFTPFAQTTASTGLFGPGSDGAVILDGVTTYARFATLAGSTYTLINDTFPSSLVVNAGVTVKMSNFRVFCRGAVINNGTITAAGNPAVGQAAGANQGSTMLIGGRAGGAGGTGVSGGGANGTNANFGSAGGGGGAGTSGTAGTGGTTTVGIGSATNNVFDTPFVFMTGITSVFSNTLGVTWGAGGGGGGSDASSNAGGGGGGGGGAVFIMAYSFTNNGTVTVAGGAGAAGAAGNAGGGGGGAGGVIAVYTLTPWAQNGTLTVAGGALGAGVGTGANGVAGGVGVAFNGIIN